MVKYFNICYNKLYVCKMMGHTLKMEDVCNEFSINK